MKPEDLDFEAVWLDYRGYSIGRTRFKRHDLTDAIKYGARLFARNHEPDAHGVYVQVSPDEYTSGAGRVF